MLSESERLDLIVDWVEGAQTGVPERYFALRTVTGWVREAGFQLLKEEVRGQSMITVAELPPTGEDGER
jgi:hypothetical protein